ncbi:MAG: hypothetical protein HYX92_09465 [Chloroflexi bacterium]|nr:hypothetical protein [Chloroflexota bacterium]
MSEIKLVFHHAFKLTPCQTSQGTCFRPLLPVRLSYNASVLDLNCMIDTGADFSMFDYGVAEALGIPVTGLMLDRATTREGEIRAWYCPVTITLLGVSLGCRVAFINNPKWPPVLGRDTVFSKFQFAFRQSVRQFYASSKVS